MRLFADYHLHSKHSDGRATIEEMAQAARQQGLAEIAITDHGPNNIGTGVKNAEQYLRIKEETRRLSRDLGDLKVLCGAEADIIDLEGGIDVPRDIYQQLDLLLVGLHPFVLPANLSTAWNYVFKNIIYKSLGKSSGELVNTNTKTLVEAMHKHDVDIITHPGLGMPLNLEEIARACVATDTAFEINVGHLFQTVEEIKMVAREGVNFVVNSDAHFTASVGKLEGGLALLQQAGVAAEQVINAQ